MKKTRILSAMIATLLLVSCVGCSGAGSDAPGVPSSDDAFIWTNDSTISGLSDKGKTLTEVVIPAKCTAFDSFKLSDGVAQKVSFESSSAIDLSSVFSFSTTLEKVLLPSELTELPDNCFMNCSALKEVKIPDNVSTLPMFCFSKCSSLTDVTMSNVKVISDKAFFGCASLESVKLPDSVETIGNAAFNQCNALKDINLPDGITSMGDRVFQDCPVLESIELPASLKTVGSNLIYNSGIKEIVVPEDLELTTWQKGSFGSSISYKVRVVKGSWADSHFDEVFGSMAQKVY